MLEELKASQGRPLESVYCIVYLDALVVKIRDGGSVRNKSIYVAVGVPVDGNREVLGLWVQESIVHVIRSSTRFVTWQDRKAVCADLRPIYNATDAEAAEDALEAFVAKWDKQYPTVAKAWRRRWDEIVPFLAYPAEMRKAIYTTNAIEALNRNFRKAVKTRGHMPSDDAAIKLLYLSLRHERKGTVRRSREWTKALRPAIEVEYACPQTTTPASALRSPSDKAVRSPSATTTTTVATPVSAR